MCFTDNLHICFAIAFTAAPVRRTDETLKGLKRGKNDRRLVANLTRSFPQGRALSHKKDRLAGSLSELRFSPERPSSQSRPLPLQVLLSMHRVSAPPALETGMIGVVLGLAVGRGEAPVVHRRVGPRLLFAGEAARALGQKAEKLVAGEVV